MALSKDEIIEAIAALSVTEVVELVKAMEEKFGVSAAAAVAAAPAAGGIERHRGYPDTVRTEVGVQIMHTVLREDSDFVKRFSPKIQEGIAHLFHS